jgi:predicted mannosyl-3-phosphoglycerate phosphatase (HAD superfamily)
MDFPHAAIARGPILFIDVDGTFLRGVEGDEVRTRRLASLHQVGPVVFVSSRTVPEMHRFGRQHDFDGDCIAENGVFTVIRDEKLAGRYPGSVTRHGVRAPWFLAADGWSPRQLGAEVERALARAGVSTEALLGDAVLEAGRRNRWGSLLLPARVADTAQGAQAIATVRGAGLHAALGGRWLTIWRGPNKGEAIRRYARAVEDLAGARPATVAIGDADNDAPMLRAADRAFAFPDESGRLANSLQSIPGVEVLPTAAAEGWHDVLTHLEGMKESLR